MIWDEQDDNEEYFSLGRFVYAEQLWFLLSNPNPVAFHWVRDNLCM